MKCLKNVQTGNIIRVEDKQADQMAGITWQYVPKSEWKLATRKPEPVTKPTKTISDSVIRGYEGETVSEKAIRRSKLKAKQRQ